ncbi:ImpA family type VI secretion system protein [Xanthobacter sp. AM11]|uniref:type VI secretion system protein TssA n=1 Tax=Xanthobacter sp. AM11 TaxID=3380643 RepID=UPI0039BFE9E3
MALLDAGAFCEPISAQEPCGPDLDATFDLDFSGFLARIEGVLPRSFFTFKRGDIDFRQELDTVRSLSLRTRDLRLLVVYAKLAVLNRDIAEFANALNVIAAILAARWEQVHPQAEGGRLDLRIATLMTLDDLPQVILPLQHLPIAEGRRFGTITYRMVQIATGSIAPREGEPVMEADSIERAFLDMDVNDLRARRAVFAAVVDAVERIDAASLGGGGHDNRVHLQWLKGAGAEIARFLDVQIARIEPAVVTSAEDDATPEGEGGEATRAPAAAAAVASRAQAVVALRAVEAYFEQREPSSPALVVVRFARQLMGKPFHEVLRLVVPDHAGRAEIGFASNTFRLPLDHLATSLGDRGWDAEEPGEDVAEVPAVEGRAEALRLLDQVAAFLRAAEPSNPVPLLVTRARDLAGRDFSALLKDMFTESALRAMRGDA